MADDIQITPGSGATIATDYVTRNSAQEHQQIIKISLGAENYSDLLLDSGQQTSANSMPVTIASDQDFVKAEGASYAGSDKGIMALGVRNDALATRTSGDGQYSPVALSTTGAVHVAIDSTSQPSAAKGLLKTGNAAHSQSDAGVMTLGVRNDTPSALTTGDTDYSPIRVDQYGNVRIWNVESKAENAAFSTSDLGTMALAVRKDTASALANADGNYIPLIVGSTGRLWVSALLDTAIPAGTNAIGKLVANSGVIIGDVNVVSAIPGTGATNLGKADSAAHSTSDVGVMALGVRNDNAATTLAASNGNYCPKATDLTGAQFVVQKVKEAAWETQGAIAVGSLTTSYQTLKDLDDTTKMFWVQNFTDIPIFVSMDATNDHFVVPAYTTITMPLGQAFLQSTAIVSVKRGATAGVEGSVYAGGAK